NRIEALFRQYSRKIWERVDEVTKFGVCFLSHFLYIHPFMNRNGRVA
ncbi:20043_t:CDS:1, partial [Rhizophagus irregularis]